MLARVGIKSVDELLTAVPKDARGPAMGVPAGLSELEIQAHMERIAALDRTTSAGPFFIGGPVQRRYIPPADPPFPLRGEFPTPYTPYPPHVSQGPRHARWASTSSSARGSRSASRSRSAARTSGSWAAATRSCARCPAASLARPSTRTAHAAS